MSKWVIWAHFRHLRFNSFPMIWRTFQSIGFWPLKSLSKHSGVHWDSNSQSGSSFGSVRAYSLTLSCTLGSMWHDTRASLLARNLATPCLGHKPKFKVVTKMDITFSQNKHFGQVGPFKRSWFVVTWGLFSFTWNLFIFLDIMFSHLYNIIPLIGLDVLIIMILDNIKCYLWNTIVVANLHFITMK
jgi:hypothetical protein